MLNKHLNGFILLCASGLLSACASAPTHFYTLESQSRPPVVATSQQRKKTADWHRAADDARLA